MCEDSRSVGNLYLPLNFVVKSIKKKIIRIHGAVAAVQNVCGFLTPQPMDSTPLRSLPTSGNNENVLCPFCKTIDQICQALFILPS